MEHHPSNADSPRVCVQSLVDLVAFVYRSLVVDRRGVTAEWRGLAWTEDAACADHRQVTPLLCAGCPVVRSIWPQRWLAMTVPSGTAGSVEPTESASGAAWNARSETSAI